MRGPGASVPHLAAAARAQQKRLHRRAMLDDDDVDDEEFEEFDSASEGTHPAGSPSDMSAEHRTAVDAQDAADALLREATELNKVIGERADRLAALRAQIPCAPTEKAATQSEHEIRELVAQLEPVAVSGGQAARTLADLRVELRQLRAARPMIAECAAVRAEIRALRTQLADVHTRLERAEEAIAPKPVSTPPASSRLGVPSAQDMRSLVAGWKHDVAATAEAHSAALQRANARAQAARDARAAAEARSAADVQARALYEDACERAADASSEWRVAASSPARARGADGAWRWAAAAEDEDGSVSVDDALGMCETAIAFLEHAREDGVGSAAASTSTPRRSRARGSHGGAGDAGDGGAQVETRAAYVSSLALCLNALGISNHVLLSPRAFLEDSAHAPLSAAAAADSRTASGSPAQDGVAAGEEASEAALRNGARAQEPAPSRDRTGQSASPDARRGVHDTHSPDPREIESPSLEIESPDRPAAGWRRDAIPPDPADGGARAAVLTALYRARDALESARSAPPLHSVTADAADATGADGPFGQSPDQAAMALADAEPDVSSARHTPANGVSGCARPVAAEHTPACAEHAITRPAVAEVRVHASASAAQSDPSAHAVSAADGAGAPTQRLAPRRLDSALLRTGTARAEDAAAEVAAAPSTEAMHRAQQHWERRARAHTLSGWERWHISGRIDSRMKAARGQGGQHSRMKRALHRMHAYARLMHVSHSQMDASELLHLLATVTNTFSKLEVHAATRRRRKRLREGGDATPQPGTLSNRLPSPVGVGSSTGSSFRVRYGYPPGVHVEENGSEEDHDGIDADALADDGLIE